MSSSVVVDEVLDDGLLQSCDDCQFTWMPHSTWRDDPLETDQGGERNLDEQEQCPVCKRDGLQQHVITLKQAIEVSDRRIKFLERQVEGLESGAKKKLKKTGPHMAVDLNAAIQRRVLVMLTRLGLEECSPFYNPMRFAALKLGEDCAEVGWKWWENGTVR
jgi:hypothetical protein